MSELLTTYDSRGAFHLWNILIATLAISALGGVAIYLIRRHRPLVRHRVLCEVWLALLVCPLLIGVVGALQLGMLPVTASAYADAGDAVHAIPAESTARRIEGGKVTPRIADAARHSPTMAIASLPAITLASVLGAVWIVGVAVAAWRMLRGWLVCRRLMQSVRVVHEDRLRSIVDRACDVAQLDLRVPLGTTPLAAGPLTLGVRKSIIILPDWVEEQLDEEELLCVLTHEAAHIARHDAPIAWLCQVCACLHWWNPLVRLLKRETNQAREELCDEFVVRARGTGDTLAAVLVKLAELCHVRAGAIPPTAIALMQEADVLSKRITRLTQGESAMKARLDRRARISLVMLSCLLAACTVVPALRATPPARGGKDSLPAGHFQQIAMQSKPSGAPSRLSYNDGSADGKKSIAGAAEALSFKLSEKEAKVAALRIHGSRYGNPQPPKEDFEVLFLNQDLSEVLVTKMVPYARFKRGGESWIEIKFPQPVTVPEEFWVGLNFHAERTKGVYVSYDSSTDGSRSRVGLPGQEFRDAKLAAIG